MLCRDTPCSLRRRAADSPSAAVDARKARRDPAIFDPYNGGRMKIPVFRALNADHASSIADDLRRYGLVVVDMSRTGAIELAARLAEELDVDEGDDSEDAVFLLHLSCEVEPVMEYGWMEYFIYSEAFSPDPMEAKALVGSAVRQWGTVGKPDYFVAKLNP